jgi:hypothetical protein
MSNYRRRPEPGPGGVVLATKGEEGNETNSEDGRGRRAHRWRVATDLGSRNQRRPARARASNDHDDAPDDHDDSSDHDDDPSGHDDHD